MKNLKQKIGVVGLGKLGLPMAAAFISRGFDVYGYDQNYSLMDGLRANSCKFTEPGLTEIIASDSKRWPERFCSSIADLVDKCDFIFIIVPTPSLDSNIFDISSVEASLKEIAKESAIISKELCCVITSTVNPGDSDNLIKIISMINPDVSLVYSPEFIALGSVLRDMLNPDVVLLGSNHDAAISKVSEIYSRLYRTYPEFHRLSFVEAEIAKIAINTFVTTKISFANMIGMFVEHFGGCNNSAQRTLNAIGGDSRIGRKYFKFGASYGGPCFPRDNRALAVHLSNAGINPRIPLATDEINWDIFNYWQRKIYSLKFDAVVLYGLAYKSGTDYLGESFMIKLGESLLLQGVAVFYSDDLCQSFVQFSPVQDLIEKISNYKNIGLILNYGAVSNHFSGMDNVVTLNIWAD